MRTCSLCNETKANAKFRTHHTKCRSCLYEIEQERYKTLKSKDSEHVRKTALKRRYGITIEQYNEILQNQKGCCAICERHHSEFKTRLAVDHNHLTGELRGLLCGYCNRYRVGRHRDAVLLRKIADYVDQGLGLFVPKKKKRRTVKRKPV